MHPSRVVFLASDTSTQRGPGFDAVEVIVHHDESGGITDIDIIGLPDNIVIDLARYDARHNASDTQISLDNDARWLWLHFSDAAPCAKFGGYALAAFVIDAGNLSGVRIQFTDRPHPTMFAKGGHRGPRQ